jgi:hypothetical protein
LIIAAIASCGALAGPVGTAQAGNRTIVRTFRAANRHLNADEAAVTRTVTAYRRNHRARPVIAALHREVRDIRTVRRAINHEHASTRKGRQGKADVIAGLSLIASAYAALATDINNAHVGHPVSRSKINAAVARAERGRAKLLTGLELLGARIRG